MIFLAHEEISRGEVLPPQWCMGSIREVTLDQVRRAASMYLDPSRFTVAVVGPAHEGPFGAGDWPGR